MPHSLRRYTRYVHFLPGIALLLFGIMGLHASVRLPDAEFTLQTHHNVMMLKATSTDLEEAADDHAKAKWLTIRIERLHAQVYWSIIAISITGFLLVVLNADKLERLIKLNEERIENLRALEFRAAAIEASLEGIAITDGDGNINFMNQALMDLHGIKPEEKGLYIDKSWLNLYTPKGRIDIQEHVLPTLERDGFWRGSSPIVKQGGEIVYANMSITRLSNGGFIGTARDITAEEMAAREKREMTDQLHQAQKMEAIGRLAGGIAHDFNNILAAMNGYAEFLTEDLDPKTKQHGFARSILQAGRQARSLVDKILAFSRRTETNQSVFDLKEPLNESLVMIQASISKSIELVVDTDLAEAPIKGSPIQIAQVIMNLFVNACDAMEDEHGKLVISLESRSSNDVAPEWLSETLPDPQKIPRTRIDDIASDHTRLRLGQLAKGRDYIVLRVQDTGTGMSRKVIEHIFEPFFTTKPVDKGTGLGLATVHGVIASHSAAMEINSAIGQGTRFEIYFPRSEEKMQEEEIPQKAIRKEQGSGRVLLIEDQEDVRLMAITMLQRLGYETETAENGLIALDRLREKPGYYDLVLTDQNMPKMTGLELVLEVQYDFPDLPFVLLSGYAEEKLQEIMAQHPAIKAVLRKPISGAALGQALEQVLKSQKSTKSKVA